MAPTASPVSLLLILLVVCSRGVDIIVDQAGGNTDNNCGRDGMLPCATIEAGSMSANGGDVLVVQRGTYEGE
ncbi:MAG: hypothetical protein MI748_12200 [Opitutales bacterium]|nr:hypothetical protein [Opitutales bacterium]